MSVIILDDEIVHYEVLGRGRPLIFLHGWVGSWRYWIPAMQATSTGFRSYALDLWGFGDSANKTINYALHEQVRLLERFLDSMGIGRIGLIGHGLGALVALSYTAQFPNAVDRLMAICLPFDERSLNPRLRTASPAELAAWLLGRSPATETGRLEAPKTDPLAIITSLEDLRELDVMAIAAQTQTPGLLVYGEDDPTEIAPPQGGGDLLGEHYHQISFENSGHFPMLDEPSKFNRLMSDFLSLESGESPRNLQLKEEWKRRVR